MKQGSSEFSQNVKDYVFHQCENWKHLELEELRKKVIDYYLSNETYVNMIKSKTGHLWGDYCLTCPTYLMPKDIALYSDENKVYLYKLTHRTVRSVIRIIEHESWLGINHGACTEFVINLYLDFH